MSKSEQIIKILSDRGIHLSRTYLDAIRILDNPEVDVCLNIYDEINKRIFMDVGALIYRFKQHSEHEYEGGMIIEGVSLHQTGRVREDLMRHSRDEKRHHKMFEGMANHLCRKSGYLPIEPRKSSGEEVVKAFSVSGGVRQFMCSLHVAEIRNYFILSVYKNCILNGNVFDSSKFDSIIKSVFDDEIRHISYTAGYVSQWSDENISISEELKFYLKNYPIDCWHEISNMTNYFSCNEITYFV